MIITKVTIDNFKIFRHKEFKFGDNKLVLLTGANGFGKTTLIDAIEWCLTGDIARLKKCYCERNTTQSEIKRVENKKGIIKNNDSGQYDIVKVMLTLKIDNEEVKVSREQKEDSLYVVTKLKFVGDVSPEIKDRINRFAANDKFYNYHVCDIFKSYDFLNSNRQEIKNKFEDFVKTHPLADSFSVKLTELQDRIKKSIEDLEKEKMPQARIDDTNKEIDSIKKNELLSIDYPQIKFYEEENLSIEKEEIEKVREQLRSIKVCGYNTVASKIEDVILYYEAKEKNRRLDELIEIFNSKESDLHIAIKNSYHSIEKLEGIKGSIRVNFDEKTKVQKAKNLSDIDTSTNMEIYSEIVNDIKIQRDEIVQIEVELHKKQEDIRNKEKGNEIITALSNLVVSREGVIKYKNEGNKKCPLCGSDEKFSKISQSSELAVEAQAYLSKNKSELASMKKSEQEINEKLNAKFEQLKQFIIKHFDEKLKVFEDQKTTFNNYYAKTKDFFEKLKKIDIPINQEYIDKIKENKAELTQVLMNGKSINSNQNIIKNILIVIDYKTDFDNITVDSLKKIQIEIKQLCNETLLVANLTFETFNQKLLFISNILNNQKICEKELQIKKYISDNTTIENEIEELKGYKEKAKKRHDKIEKKKADIEKLELVEVGRYLYKIFTKVIKHTSITNFEFNRDGSRVTGGATFTDQNGNNILNILSQGQLGVFILAYFFANMLKRKEETQFKTYFVDDITNCMDDMNVLSFVDIIKYQLYRKDGVINQFFFSTCNEDLEELFVHKMKSFGIDWINFKFNSYARGTIYDKMGQTQCFG